MRLSLRGWGRQHTWDRGIPAERTQVREGSERVVAAGHIRPGHRIGWDLHELGQVWDHTVQVLEPCSHLAVAFHSCGESPAQGIREHTEADDHTELTQEDGLHSLLHSWTPSGTVSCCPAEDSSGHQVARKDGRPGHNYGH
jgi:hypothetical protein